MLAWWLVACASAPEATSSPVPRVLDLQESRPVDLDLVAWVDLSLDQPAAVSAICQALDDSTDAYLEESTDPALEHRLTLTGLRPLTEYRCAALPAGGRSEIFSLETGGVDPALPTVEIERDQSFVPRTAFALTNHVDLCVDRRRQHLLVYDQDGALRWAWKVPGTDGPGIEASYLGDGRILWGGGRRVGGVPEVVTWDHQTAPAVPFTGSEDLEFHHDAALLPDGEFLALHDMDGAAGGLSWLGFGVTAFDSTDGGISWDWGDQAGVDEGVLDPGDGSDEDPFHANALSWESRPGGDRLWVGLCGDSSVLAVDVATGAALGKLGRHGDLSLTDPQGEHLDNSHFFTCNHGVVARDDRVLVYDNGINLDSSRVLEYRVDLDAGSAVLWWQWTEPDWHEGTLGDADWIDDDRVFVTQAHNECTVTPQVPGDRSALVEVDVETGEVPWRLTFGSTQDTNYRAHSLPGCGVFSSTRWCPETQARFDTLADGLDW